MLSTWITSHIKFFQKFLYWTILIFLTIFVGFRDDVGCDFTAYQNHFLLGYELTLLKASISSDPAYWLMVSFLDYIGLHSQSLNIVTSIIFFIGMHSLAKRQPNPIAFLALSFPILIINMPMSATRQSISIGLMCLAYSAFIDKRVIKFSLIVFIGSLFHSSILVFLLLTPFIKKRFSIQSIFWGLFFLIPVFFLLINTESATVATSRYLETETDALGAIFRLAVLAFGGIYFFIFFSKSWQKKFPYDFKIVRIGSVLMILSFFLVNISSVIGDRFGYYLIPIQSIIFSRIPYLNLGKFNLIHSLIPYALLTLTFLVWTLTSWHFAKCYIPYQYDFSL